MMSEDQLKNFSLLEFETLNLKEKRALKPGELPMRPFFTSCQPLTATIISFNVSEFLQLIGNMAFLWSSALGSYMESWNVGMFHHSNCEAKRS